MAKTKKHKITHSQMMRRIPRTEQDIKLKCVFPYHFTSRCAQVNLKNSAHNETVVKFASSKDEVKRAFELAKDIFVKDPNSQSSTFKELSWNIKADNIFKNIIIATSGSDIIGVVRLCPRTFLWQKKNLKWREFQAYAFIQNLEKWV